MVATFDFMIFAAAAGASAAVMWSMIAPQWQRILRLASGQVEPTFAPLAHLAAAERRITVRRQPQFRRPASLTPLREVA